MNSLSEHTDEQSYVRQFLSSKDNDFGHIVLSVFKSRAFAEDALFPVRLGIHLREKGHFSIANTLFSACLDYSCRASALFELGVLKSITGEVDQSVFYLEMRLKESGLQPQEKVFFARQYARQGRIGRAAALLEEAADLNPHLRHECLVSLQSFKFMNRFDKRVTLGLLEEVKSLYNVYTHESQVERRINEALAKGDPFLLLRMGDGEGSAIRLSIEDDAEYNLLYRDNLEEFTQFWFNDRSIAVDPEFLKLLMSLIRFPSRLT
jgi:tetratricopeptide (TPR) repeat protein